MILTGILSDHDVFSDLNELSQLPVHDYVVVLKYDTASGATNSKNKHLFGPWLLAYSHPE